MWTIMIFVSIILWYYFAIKSILEKENKEKVFFIVFMTIVFVLLMTIVNMLELWFINIIIFPLFLFIAHWFYSDFIMITRIEEYLLRNQNDWEISLRIIILNLLNKEIKILKEDIYSIITFNAIVLDIVALTIWIILTILFILHISGIIDVFVLISKILN